MNLPRLWWVPAGKVPEVAPQELNDWQKNGKAVQIVDARTALEYHQGTIGDARHAPLTEMPASMENLELDASRVVVVVCLSGHRSIPGTRWLRARGYQAYSLRGGLIGWKHAGYPLENPATR